MKALLIFLFIASSGPASAAGKEGPPSDQEVCQKLLDFIYQDITLKNMGTSLERLNNKMVLGFMQALKNSNQSNLSMRSNPELLSLFESMKKIDPDFESYLKQNRPYANYKFWDFIPFWRAETRERSYQTVISKWRELQARRPGLFAGLREEHLLDEWDMKTAKLLEDYAQLRVSNPALKSSLDQLARQYRSNYQNLAQNGSSSYSGAIRQSKEKIDRLHREFNASAKDLFWESLDQYKNVCDISKINALLSAQGLSCPYSEQELPTQALSLQLRDISAVISSDFLNQNQKPPTAKASRPELEVRPYQYENINYDGSYCERDPAMADTVVIHHSATSNELDPQDIHDLQVATHENDRDSAGNPDPWYMIAYNYVVKAPYEDDASDPPQVFEGRPDHIKGAHAGGHVNLNQLDPKVRRLVENSNIQCGWNKDKDSGHRMDTVSENATDLTREEINDGFVSANITSVGVLVNGNFAPDILNGRPNVSGYPSNGPVRYPSETTLRTTAKLICKLKNGDYPNLRKITDHNYARIKKKLADGEGYFGTCCPGTVYYRLNKLLELTKEECPEHQFALDISPKEHLCHFLKNL